MAEERIMSSLAKLTLDSLCAGDLVTASRLKECYQTLLLPHNIGVVAAANVKVEESKDEESGSKGDTASSVDHEESKMTSLKKIHTTLKEPKIIINVLELEVDYGKAILRIIGNTQKAFFSLDQNEEVRKTVRNMDTAHLSEQLSKNADIKTYLSASFVKNFPKVLGDKLSKYLHIKTGLDDTRKIFKDNCSFKKLNDYLGGCSTLSGISTRAFLQLFSDFISNEFSDESIDSIKSQDKDLKTCYKLILRSFRAMYSALTKWNVNIKSFEILKIWPLIELKLDLM